MKKIIFSICILGATAVAGNAQANSVLVFGNFGLGSAKTATDDKSFNFNLNPGIGYQFDDNWTVGVEGGYGTFRERAKASKSWSYSDNYKAGAFVRFTKGLGRQNIFAFFAQTGLGYQGSNVGSTVTNSTSTYHNGVYAYVTPAIGVNVYKGFALNFGFGGVDFYSTKMQGSNNSATGINLTFGQQVNIGISKNFSCSKRKHHASNNHGSKTKKHQEDDDNDESED